MSSILDRFGIVSSPLDDSKNRLRKAREEKAEALRKPNDTANQATPTTAPKKPIESAPFEKSAYFPTALPTQLMWIIGSGNYSKRAIEEAVKKMQNFGAGQTDNPKDHYRVRLAAIVSASTSPRDAAKAGETLLGLSKPEDRETIQAELALINPHSSQEQIDAAKEQLACLEGGSRIIPGMEFGLGIDAKDRAIRQLQLTIQDPNSEEEDVVEAEEILERMQFQGGITPEESAISGMTGYDGIPPAEEGGISGMTGYDGIKRANALSLKSTQRLDAVCEQLGVDEEDAADIVENSERFNPFESFVERTKNTY